MVGGEKTRKNLIPAVQKSAREDERRAIVSGLREIARARASGLEASLSLSLVGIRLTDELDSRGFLSLSLSLSISLSRGSPREYTRHCCCCSLMLLRNADAAAVCLASGSAGSGWLFSLLLLLLCLGGAGVFCYTSLLRLNFSRELLLLTLCIRLTLVKVRAYTRASLAGLKFLAH